MNGNDPVTDPTQGIARDRWERILAKALNVRNQSPNDPNAHDAIRQAEAALAHYDKANPNVGGLFPQSQKAGAYAGSALESLGQIPSKTAGFAGDIAEGIAPTGPQGNLDRALASGLHSISSAIDPMRYVQPETRQALAASQADNPGLTLAGQVTGNLLPMGPSIVRGGINAMRAGASGIGGLLKGIFSGGIKAAAKEAPEAAEGAAEAAQAGAAGASPAGAGPQLTPMEGSPKGLEFGKGQPAPKVKPPTNAMNALSKMQGIDITGATGTPQFEEGLPAARTSTMPAASKFDIDNYLRQIAQAMAMGYGR